MADYNAQMAKLSDDMAGQLFLAAQRALVERGLNVGDIVRRQIRRGEVVCWRGTKDGELHYGEAVEEKISLSERFGLWLSFHPFSQDDYLAIVAHWLEQLDWSAGLDTAAREEALRWALQRGSRSGRVAWQFARDWVGRNSL